LASLRAIPNLTMVRPGDAAETAIAWLEILRRRGGPTGIALTRQNIPVFERGEGEASGAVLASAEGTARGAYILAEAANGSPDVILIATGSEVQLAIEARTRLAAEGVHARVVSAPSLEWFAEQDAAYREHVLPAAVTARVSVEAGIAMPWRDIVGDRGRSISIEHFGASADYQTLFEKFGITTDAVVAAAHEVLG
ncbi:MAG: transketolase, partial [Microthrixaceae bacterium]|nr:transketolase [Microthrixaceae bacterium]